MDGAAWLSGRTPCSVPHSASCLPLATPARTYVRRAAAIALFRCGSGSGACAPPLGRCVPSWRSTGLCEPVASRQGNSPLLPGSITTITSRERDAHWAALFRRSSSSCNAPPA